MPIDTLKTRRQEHSERLVRKVMSGGGVRAPSRYSEKTPQELKAQEGIERGTGLTSCLSQRIAARINALKAERVDTGSGGATRREENLANTMRARLADEASRLGSGASP